MTQQDDAFPGVIATTVADSTPWWSTSAAAGRPNVIVVILDDTGWSDLGCYGSEIRTPAIDSIAARGTRHTRFHVTPLCSPTRASFLTGRNHHAVGMRFLADADTGFPNSRGAIHPDVVTLPERLRDAGYATYLAGKWHLAPYHELTPAGPFHNWPLAQGFDRFYGFLGGATDQFEPELFEDNHPVPPSGDPDYHLSEDLVTRSMGFLRDHTAFRPDAPFYLQLAFGATHAPFQAPRSYIDEYVATFAKGWDATRADRLARQVELGLVPDGTELAERNDGVPPWDALTEDERIVFGRLQAAFAGFLEHADAQLGRLLEFLDRHGLSENTIVVVLSDNGASREGGRAGDIDTNAPYSGIQREASEMIGGLDAIGTRTGGAHYPEGWAMAGNTPFRRYKQFVDLGGVRAPLVMAGPGIARGAIAGGFGHVIDLAPTLYELIGLEVPDDVDGAPLTTERRTQYWEMLGHRAIWDAGWRAVAEHVPGTAYEDDRWRVYDTSTDFSEVRDLANENPERLAELQRLWWAEARRNQVLPLDDRPLRSLLRSRGPSGLLSRRSFTLVPGQSHLGMPTAVVGSNRSVVMEVRLAGGADHATGTALSSGNVQGGYFIALDAGVPVFEHAFLGERSVARGSGRIGPDVRTLALELRVDADRSAAATLTADGVVVAACRIRMTSGHLSFRGMDVGAASGSTFSTLQGVALPEGLVDRIDVRVTAATDRPAQHAEAILAEE